MSRDALFMMVRDENRLCLTTRSGGPEHSRRMLCATMSSAQFEAQRILLRSPALKAGKMLPKLMLCLLCNVGRRGGMP